jgi:hypothetical protein
MKNCICFLKIGEQDPLSFKANFDNFAANKEVFESIYIQLI